MSRHSVFEYITFMSQVVAKNHAWNVRSCTLAMTLTEHVKQITCVTFCAQFSTLVDQHYANCYRPSLCRLLLQISAMRRPMHQANVTSCTPDQCPSYIRPILHPLHQTNTPATLDQYYIRYTRPMPQLH